MTDGANPSQTELASEVIKNDIMVRAAWMYYTEEMTQQQIADRLGLSRVKVIRLLKEARNQGVVEIKINSPFSTHLWLEGELRKKYGLVDAFVTLEAPEGEALNRMLASTAAQVLEQRLHSGIWVGLGLGRTVSYIPEYISYDISIDCTFIPLSGGLNYGEYSEDNYRSLFQLAKAVGATVRFIHSPFTVSDPKIRDAILKDATVQESIDLARKVDIAVFSVGMVSKEAMLYLSGLMSNEDLSEIAQLNAKGDVLGRFYDDCGRELQYSLKDRIVGLNIEELQVIPIRLLVAGGPKKYEAIRAALCGEIANIVVTDADTTRWLLSRGG
jgi:DNA-binding transcriptional regulator LsrR (DeoR family)